MQQDIVKFTISSPLTKVVEMEASSDYAKFLQTEITQLMSKRINGQVIEHVINNEPLIDGLILEFGVMTGYSINKISSLLPNKTVYGFDSFHGLPNSWEINDLNLSFPKGAFSMKGVLPKVNQNVRLNVGLFSDTMPQFFQQHTDPIALLHIDCDMYESTVEVLTYLADRIIPGTIIIFDEFFLYQDEAKAFYEFIKRTGKKFEWLAYGEGGGVETNLASYANFSEYLVKIKLYLKCRLKYKSKCLPISAAVKIV